MRHAQAAEEECWEAKVRRRLWWAGLWRVVRTFVGVALIVLFVGLATVIVKIRIATGAVVEHLLDQVAWGTL